MKKKDDAVLKVKARCQKISQAVFGLKKKKKNEKNNCNPTMKAVIFVFP